MYSRFTLIKGFTVVATLSLDGNLDMERLHCYNNETKEMDGSGFTIASTWQTTGQ